MSGFMLCVKSDPPENLLRLTWVNNSGNDWAP